jgi:hypothetical protein
MIQVYGKGFFHRWKAFRSGSDLFQAAFRSLSDDLANDV